MKESNHPKTHKRDVCPWGYSEMMDLCSKPVIQTKYVHVCMLAMIVFTVSSCLGKSSPNWALSRPEFAQ